MDFGRIWGYLTTGAGEQDALFSVDLQRLHLVGLQVMGWTEITVAGFALLAQTLADAAMPSPARGPALYFGRTSQAALVVLAGAVTLAVARTRAGRAAPAFLLCLSAWFSSALLIGSFLLLTPHAPDEYIAAHITTVLLVAIIAAPLHPRQTLMLGSSIWLVYVAAFLAGAYWKLIDWAAWDISHLVFLVPLTLLSTALSAVLYEQRKANYRAHQESIRLTEYLAAAPVRALLSENAISVGRLAAALTHELNTPLGALKSSIDTMIVLAAKQATAPPEAQPRLVALQTELRNSVNQCMDRLKNVISRLQRFIDLHHTERKPSDVNEILGDVAILLKPGLSDQVRLEFNLLAVPRVTCRPQQITAVFSSLLSNAINAVNGGGRVLVSTDKLDSVVRIRVEDNGHGMDDGQLETIFDPGFKETAGRVSTGNWSLFSSRQIIFEHGGEIQISSIPGKGTTVDVLLPI
jgi:signal transduction histidine kinase